MQMLPPLQYVVLVKVLCREQKRSLEDGELFRAFINAQVVNANQSEATRISREFLERRVFFFSLSHSHRAKVMD